MKSKIWMTAASCAAMVTAVARAQGAGQNILPGAIQPGTVHVGLQTVATGLVAPVLGVAAPGDASDLFVVDQAGKIVIVHNGTVQPTPFLDVSALEASVPLSPGYDERGLLGLA